jgi:hypothetical protein
LAGGSAPSNELEVFAENDRGYGRESAGSMFFVGESLRAPAALWIEMRAVLALESESISLGVLP